MSRDLGKPLFETEISESGWLMNDIVFITRNLHKWVKDEKAQDIDLSFKFMNPKIRKDPLGCVLVMGYVRPEFVASPVGNRELTCSAVHSTSPSS